MKSSPWTAVKRFVFWDYPRGSVPYDIMVALILAFVFLTPRGFFRDQPKGNEVVMLPEYAGASVFYLDSGLLSILPESERQSRAQELIRQQSGGKQLRLVRLEPIFDSEEEIRGYMAYAEP